MRRRPPTLNVQAAASRRVTPSAIFEAVRALEKAKLPVRKEGAGGGRGSDFVTDLSIGRAEGNLKEMCRAVRSR